MMELFALVKNESIERASVKTSEDWKKIMTAIDWIKKDPYQKITTRELAQKVFTNEYTLKVRFKEFTGCSIDKFRQHLVLIDVRNKMLTRGMPASLLFKKAGYNDLPALSHSMKLHLSCGPGELKSRKWNFDCNNKNIGSE
jgi:AraC-like DNA-binding protein